MATKDRILDAAERLFAQNGFAVTSLRAITAEAGVNLAAVNYHFQSKEALLQAVFARRLAPLNRERLEMLAAAEARAGVGPLPLEDVLRAAVRPVIRFGQSMPGSVSCFARLLGRVTSEPGPATADVVREQFAEIKARFLAAFRRALPDLPDTEIYWRVYFLIGALAHSMAGLHILELVSDGRCDPADVDGIEERLIAFLAAGFRAPVALPEAHHAK